MKKILIIPAATIFFIAGCTSDETETTTDSFATTTETAATTQTSAQTSLPASTISAEDPPAKRPPASPESPKN